MKYQQDTEDQIFINIAKEYSKFSKCQFTKVGAIAVNENRRIIATGVNGTISGTKNCCDHHFEQREDHVPFTKENEIHAEANLILELARSNISFKELSIYLTISPCEECFKLLLGLCSDHVKVKKIVYADLYHRMTYDDVDRMSHKAKSLSVDFYKHVDLENDLNDVCEYFPIIDVNIYEPFKF